MKTKPCIYSQPNYLLFRTAIEAVSGTIGVLAVVIASTGFVNYKSGLAMISNKPGSRQNTIPYISVNTGEQYKFVGRK